MSAAQATENETLIEVRDAGLFYYMSGPRLRLRDRLKGSSKPARKRWALRGLNFTVEHGEVLGVVGHNGAGKSTLCRVLCGIFPPDEGTVRTEGRVSAVLGLGSGMNADLSARSNVALVAAFMGIRRSQIKDLTREVEEFSDLGEFFDQPIRSYSSGMKARIGFAIATAVQPDVLVLDELVRVGDEAFREKSERRMRELMDSSKAMVLVSHSMPYLRSMCTKGLWLHKGQQKMLGPIDEVIDAYLVSTGKKPGSDISELGTDLKKGELPDDLGAGTSL